MKTFTSESLGIRLEATLAASVSGCTCTLSAESTQAILRINAENESTTAKPVPKKKGGKVKEIEAKMANFKRTKDGRLLMKQELEKLLWMDGVKFQDKPIVHPTTDAIRVESTARMQTPVLRSALLEKVGEFFSNYYIDVRAPDIFAMRVFEWMRKCNAELAQTPPERRHLLELVSLIAASDFAKDKVLPQHGQ